MGEVILSCENITLENILNKLEQNGLFDPANTVVFWERLPSKMLNDLEIASGTGFASCDIGKNWTESEKGRIFCSNWELRWEKQHIIYIGNQVNLTDFSLELDLSAYNCIEASYYLWGEKDQDRFIELQIARTLNYPILTSKRVKLKFAEWSDATGLLIASRCKALEEGE